ncbi:hypothetical protein CEY02_01015 [Bacillus pumilus]|uniref:Uncharacterized protein n=1 Tax=Bacillus pumilus TaxID=1408 RepID=A0A2A5J2I6_BACPU|nr:hypothetical protein CEY02_01015 [Bacillus pumilus]
MNFCALDQFSNFDQNVLAVLFYDQEEVREMMYSRGTQEVLAYLESHLMDELSLRQVPEKVLLST